MINEFYNGSGAVAPGTKMARDEYIEFVIVAPTTSSQLAAMTFGDSNDATSQLQGVFQFDKATLDQALASAGLGAFVPGTLITVKGANLGGQNLTYNPLANNLGNSDAWSIELVAGQGAKDAPETKINGNITFGNNGEVVWISASNPPANNTDTSGFIHAIGYDNNPGTIANAVIAKFGSENILSTTVPTGRSISNVSGTSESLVVGTTGTMGAANSVANATWITGLQNQSVAMGLVPEPSRALLLSLGFGLLTCRRQRRQLGGRHA